MHSVLWIRSAVLMCCIALSLTLVRSDTEPQTGHRPHVVFLGRDSAEVDVAFQRFLKALAQADTAGRARPKIEFINAGRGDSAQIDGAVDLAISKRPVVIVAPTAATARPAAQRIRQESLIFASVLDPVRYGIVSSTLSRRERVTGIWISDSLDGKRIEILRDAYPSARKIALFVDRPWGSNTDADATLMSVAQKLDLDLKVLYADNTEEVERVLSDREARLFDAWCIPRSGLAVLNTPLILERLRRWKKPVILANPADVSAGAPLSYSLDTSFAWPAIADLVLRVVGGEAASKIPIERPQKTVLAVRPQPAEGFPAPSAAVVRRADLVIR